MATKKNDEGLEGGKTDEKKLLTLLPVDFTSEQLNTLVMKVNEVIERLNQ